MFHFHHQVGFKESEEEEKKKKKRGETKHLENMLGDKKFLRSSNLRGPTPRGQGDKKGERRKREKKIRAGSHLMKYRQEGVVRKKRERIPYYEG